MNKLIAFSFCAMLLATACNSSEEPKSQAVVKKTEVVQQAAAVAEQPAATVTTIDWNKALDDRRARNAPAKTLRHASSPPQESQDPDSPWSHISHSCRVGCPTLSSSGNP